MFEYTDRRMYERISLPIKTEYEVRNRPKLTKESVSKNISGNGICLSLEEKLLPKTRLAIKIYLGANEDAIDLDGIVIWGRRTDNIESGGSVASYTTGIELVGADPININRIISYFMGKSF